MVYYRTLLKACPVEPSWPIRPVHSRIYEHIIEQHDVPFPGCAVTGRLSHSPAAQLGILPSMTHPLASFTDRHWLPPPNRTDSSTGMRRQHFPWVDALGAALHAVTLATRALASNQPDLTVRRRDYPVPMESFAAATTYQTLLTQWDPCADSESLRLVSIALRVKFTHVICRLFPISVHRMLVCF